MKQVSEEEEEENRLRRLCLSISVQKPAVERGGGVRSNAFPSPSPYFPPLIREYLIYIKAT